MGLDNVKEEIIEEAEEKAVALLKEAKSEAQAIKDAAKQEISLYKKDADAKQKQMVETMSRKMLAQARFDAQRMLMNSRKESIQAIVAAVQEKLSHLGKAERKEFLQKLLGQAQQEMTVAKVHVNKQDIPLLSGVAVFPAEISGGLLAVNKEGTISMDFSSDALLKEAQQESLVELSGVLFGKR
ncbi:MAG TPA: V-type ATP synthase subunit E family protein [Candidatus Nanoarchaeia archaeon]|nr:V-type ATP synthase subunit E family protein [Candidatus Nanoarchaeia archaeon]